MNEEIIMEQLALAATALRESRSAAQPHHIPERRSHRLALLAADYAAHAMTRHHPAHAEVDAKAHLQTKHNASHRGDDPARDWSFLTDAQDDFAWPCYIVVQSDNHAQSYECPRNDGHPQINPCLSCPFVRSCLQDNCALPEVTNTADQNPTVSSEQLEGVLDQTHDKTGTDQATAAHQAIAHLMTAARAMHAASHQDVLIAIAECAYFTLQAFREASKSSVPTQRPQGDANQVMSEHANLADLINSRVGAPSHWLKE